MDSELFNRLKKLAKREGKIVFADNDDVFVILLLDEYEALTHDFYDEECDGECGDENCDCNHDKDDHDLDFDFGEEVFTTNEDDKKPEDPEDDEAEKDLIKRVNEDIAKWREEQQKLQEHKNIKSQEQKEKMPEKTVETVSGNDKNDVLTEEERYYLEPLE